MQESIHRTTLLRSEMHTSLGIGVGIDAVVVGLKSFIVAARSHQLPYDVYTAHQYTTGDAAGGGCFKLSGVSIAAANGAEMKLTELHGWRDW